MSSTVDGIEVEDLGTSRPIGVLHVVAGLEARHGGPSYSVPRLAAAQSEHGAHATLASVAASETAASETVSNGYRQIRARWDCAQTPVLTKLRLSRSLQHALDATAPRVDIVHNHGLWLMPNVEAARAARRAGRPFVLAPRGMLAPEALAFSRAQKLAFWRILQGPVLHGLACIHATSLQERDEARAFGLTAPVAVVPNGVDLPDLSSPLPAPADRREVLYLGRVHPTKSIDMLIEAWARLAPKVRSGWRLRIVGPSEDGHGAALAALAASRGLGDVVFEPPIFGPAKFEAYRRAEFFVLPSQNENFGLTAAEALACETAVISTRGTPWSGLEIERCGWWPPYGVEAMAATLEAALALPDAERRAMGVRGRAWMARAFSWRAVARRLLDVYGWLRDGGEPPACVIPD